MAPNPRVSKAFRAMKDIGIGEDKTKPVLKKLLKLYDKNWELIEEENYRALADAIFEEEDTKVVEQKNCQNANYEDNLEDETQVPEEPERPLKRMRRGQTSNVVPSPSNENFNLTPCPLKTPKVEKDELPQICPPQLQLCVNVGSEVDESSSCSVDKGKEPISLQYIRKVKRPVMERPVRGVHIREPVVESGIVLFPKQKVPDSNALIKPKDEPFTEDGLNTDITPYEPPIAAIHSDPTDNDEERGSAGNEPIDGDNGVGEPASPCGGKMSSELAAASDASPSDMEIASASLGEVKISLSCNPAIGRPDFHMPSRDAVIKYMEEKCLRSYKIIDPTFSVVKLLNDMCDWFWELGTESVDDTQGRAIDTTRTLDIVEKPVLLDASTVIVDKEILNLQPCMDGAFAAQIPGISPSLSCLGSLIQTTSKDIISNGPMETNGKGYHTQSTDSRSLVVVPQSDPNPDELRCFHDISDITRGDERVKIAWINKINSEHLPSFHYLQQSLIFQDAYVNTALSKIESNSCCPTCFGDCLAFSFSCACANETGGEFAYTSDGLVKEDFLEKCISLNHDTQQRNRFYCDECPHERSKNADCSEPCKGHLERYLIKECWQKCGCTKQCGNRVVQRGITYKLQIFFTLEGKGWGLRTLEDLPKGAFVCEYVGEILTNVELYQRKMKLGRTGKHVSPLLLDAHWNSKVITDEKALCLDAAYHGNVARFINHRCLDANLIEIAVEIETPDRHYYHPAFFTTRKIDALEELTWDYGIDFDDHDHPMGTFQCQCGSKFCRNMKRSNRSRSRSNSR